MKNAQDRSYETCSQGKMETEVLDRIERLAKAYTIDQ